MSSSSKRNVALKDVIIRYQTVRERYRGLVGKKVGLPPAMLVSKNSSNLREYTEAITALEAGILAQGTPKAKENTTPPRGRRDERSAAARARNLDWESDPLDQSSRLLQSGPVTPRRRLAPSLGEDATPRTTRPTHLASDVVTVNDRPPLTNANRPTGFEPNEFDAYQDQKKDAVLQATRNPDEVPEDVSAYSSEFGPLGGSLHSADTKYQEAGLNMRSDREDAFMGTAGAGVNMSLESTVGRLHGPSGLSEALDIYHVPNRETRRSGRLYPLETFFDVVQSSGKRGKSKRSAIAAEATSLPGVVEGRARAKRNAERITAMARETGQSYTVTGTLPNI
jgi:hypothetical protein